MRESLLSVRGLTIEFPSPGGVIQAVRGFDVDVPRGGTVGLVGESGCGKSVSMMAVLGLLPEHAVVSGEVRFEGIAVDEAQRRELRGSRIAMVFQDAMRSLNPLMRVGAQVTESIRHHQKLGRKDADAAGLHYLHRVGMRDPRRVFRSYPFELSGGMRQRAMIAAALACSPDLLIADEPTTGLDVTVQAQILGLLNEIREDEGLAVIFISHDLGAVVQLCDELVVVYAGRAIERGPTRQVLTEPHHPYTKAQLRSLPTIGQRHELVGIEGHPPGPFEFPSGCSFAPRCAEAMPGVCDRQPPTVAIDAFRTSECWLDVADHG